MRFRGGRNMFGSAGGRSWCSGLGVGVLGMVDFGIGVGTMVLVGAGMVMLVVVVEYESRKLDMEFGSPYDC